jgi:hypothetical protein
MDASALASAESWLSIIGSAKLVAAFLVAIGVAIEFGGDWVAKPYEKTIEDARKLELAELHKQSDDAKLETTRLSADAESSRAAIADANARAAEAQLALEQFKADRTLSPEQQARVVEKLKQFSGQTYVLSVLPDQEAIRFAKIVDGIVRAAGWSKLASKGAITIPDDATPTSSFAAINVAAEPGVRIQIAPDRAIDVAFVARAKAIAEAFVTEGIAAEPRLVRDMADTPDAIQIRIGSKPK